jgi:DNA primase
VLWAIETAHPLKTPEQRAALEQRLEAQTRRIAHRSVQEHYRNFFRARLAETFNPGGRNGRSGWGRLASWKVGPIRRLGRGGRPLGGGYPARETPPEGDPGLLQRRAQEVLLALLLNHPFLLAEIGEELAQFELADRGLDRLCREILRLHGLHPDLDAAALKLHLSNSGFGQELAGILSSRVLTHAGFARPGAEAEEVRLGWNHTKARLQERRLLSTQISEAERQAADGTDETWSRLQPLLQSKAEDDGAAGGGMD